MRVPLNGVTPAEIAVRSGIGRASVDRVLGEREPVGLTTGRWQHRLRN